MKEVYIALIQKDIVELDMIAKGLSETKEIVPMALTLATKKAQDLLDNLAKLTENQSKQPEIEVEKEIKYPEPEILIEEEKIEIIEEKTVKIEPVPEKEIIPEEKSGTKPEVEPAGTFIQKEEAKPLPQPSPQPQQLPQAEKKLTIADKMAAGKESKLESIIKTQNTNSVASAISNKMVTELKKSISLGDRFRFQRELFSGNVDLMSQTLTNLDAVENYETAQEYLKQKFQWDYETEVVSDFLDILKRRYL